jgi:hypothetical protein
VTEEGGVTEPVSLAVLSAVALTEGIKFLYGQAGELLRRRSERKEAQAKGEGDPLGEPLAAPSRELLAGDPGPLVADPVVLDGLAGELARLRTVLEPYALGHRPVSAGHAGLLDRVDALRRGLEAVYGRRLSFAGEDREPSGTRIDGVAEAQTVRGYVAGVSVEDVSGVAEVKGTARVGDVEEGGRVFGAEVRRDQR